MKRLIALFILLALPCSAFAATKNVAKFSDNFNALVVTDEMTDETLRLLTAADKTENKLVLTLRISTNPFNNEKNLQGHIRMVDTGNDPISGKYVALRIDQNPKVDFNGFPDKTGSGTSFMIMDNAFIDQMKAGSMMKAQVRRNSGYRVVDFSLAGISEGLAWLEKGDQMAEKPSAVAATPTREKTELPIRLKAKDGSGWVDFSLLSDRVRIYVTRPGDILSYEVKLNVDGKQLKQYRASKGFDQKYEGSTVMFTPEFEERDAIQKGSEMCITVRSEIRGSRSMCFDVSHIVFH